MLLGVLILVVIAFALLIVGATGGDVLIAWISVGFSGLAALVLITDWLLRRHAVRAGEVESTPAVRAGAAPPGRSDAFPTEAVLAAPRQDAASRQDAAARQSAALRQDSDEPATEQLPVVGGGTTPPGSPRHHPPGTDQRTVVIPPVAPSGSTGRPSGAWDDDPRSGGLSSPSVTDPGGGGRGVDSAEPTADSAEAASMNAETMNAETVVASAVRPRVDGPSGDRSDRAAAVGPPSTGDRVPDRGGPPGTDVGPDGDRGTGGPGASVAHPEPIPTGSGSEDRPGRARTSAAAASDPVVAESSTVDPAIAPTALGAPAALAGPESSRAGTTASAPAAAPGSGTHPGVGTPSDSVALSGSGSPPGPDTQLDSGTQLGSEMQPDSGPPRDRGTGEGSGSPQDTGLPQTAGSAQEASAGEIAQTGAGDAAQASDPPQEDPTPAEAARVAQLDDEVVVVDERPRYHLTGCRALAGPSLFPLPAREAVELGFTPCGWCTPDRILTGRHAAGAH